MSRTRYPSPSLENDEFRLLTLLPGAATDCIECTLSISPLPQRLAQASQSCAYDALSYTWGSSSNCSITLNGQEFFPVTDNLFDALKRLRHADANRVLWIDAICINQSDVEERNVQVQYMRAIYQCANRVVIWLGEPDLSISETSLEDRSPEEALRYHDLKQNTFFHYWWRSENSLWSLKSILDKQRPLWWERLWIIQEFALAERDPIVCFGSWQVPWSDLTDILVQLLEKQSLGLEPKPESEEAISDAFGSLGKLDGIHGQDRTASSSLSSLCLHSSNANASVAKDKVYGLLGLLPKGEGEALTVDYTRSDEGVFSSATFACISASKSLNILHLLPFFRRSASMPSWIVEFGTSVDFTAAQREALMKQLAPSKDKQEFESTIHTCLVSEDQRMSCVSLSDDLKLLTVAGEHFDTVVQVIDLPPIVDCRDLAAQVANILQNISKSPYRQLCSKVDSDCSCGPEDLELSRLSVLPEAFSGVYEDLHLDEIYAHAAECLDVVFKHWIRCVWHRDEEVALRNPVVPSDFADLLTKSKQLFVTKCGFLGAAPSGIEDGDRVMLLHGCDWPVILKQRPDSKYLLHGLAFVNGIMDRELASPCFDNLKQDDFVLC